MGALRGGLLCELRVGGRSDFRRGTGTLIVGGRPNKIFFIDEATEKVTGEIAL